MIDLTVGILFYVVGVCVQEETLRNDFFQQFLFESIGPKLPVWEFYRTEKLLTFLKKELDFEAVLKKKALSLGCARLVLQSLGELFLCSFKITLMNGECISINPKESHTHIVIEMPLVIFENSFKKSHRELIDGIVGPDRLLTFLKNCPGANTCQLSKTSTSSLLASNKSGNDFQPEVLKQDNVSNPCCSKDKKVPAKRKSIETDLHLSVPAKRKIIETDLHLSSSSSSSDDEDELQKILPTDGIQKLTFDKSVQDLKQITAVIPGKELQDNIDTIFQKVEEIKEFITKFTNELKQGYTPKCQGTCPIHCLPSIKRPQGRPKGSKNKLKKKHENS